MRVRCPMAGTITGETCGKAKKNHAGARLRVCCVGVGVHINLKCRLEVYPTQIAFRFSTKIIRSLP